MDRSATQTSQEDKAKEDEQLRSQLPLMKPVLMVSLICGLTGWLGLALIVLFTVPTLGPRWLMFFLVTLAISGPALPVVHYLHRRFPSKPVATGSVLVREALWFGVYADILLWLQFGRALSFALSAFIAVGVIAIELIIRWRERTTWKPPAE
jgi:hypothetical protein